MDSMIQKRKRICVFNTCMAFVFGMPIGSEQEEEKKKAVQDGAYRKQQQPWRV
jgi:hypothetical protein